MVRFGRYDGDALVTVFSEKTCGGNAGDAITYNYRMIIQLMALAHNSGFSCSKRGIVTS